MAELTASPELAEPPVRPRWRADLAAVALALVLVGAAVAVGLYFNRPGSGVVIWAFSPPLYAYWIPHYGPGSAFAVLVAAVLILWGPLLAARLRWRSLLAVGYVASLGWTYALTTIDGWWLGFESRLENPHEYLKEVPGITDIPATLRTFSSRILDFQPDSWTTHVSGHPPGATLVFVWLDRLGLSGGAWGAVLCVLVGSLAAVAVPVTVAALGREDAARAMLPFAVLFPGAVWMGVSADGMFTGVTASGIALLAVAGRGDRVRVVPALVAGLLLGFGLYLSYGLVLLGLLALAVVLASRRPWTLLPAGIGVAAVAAVFTLAGFWWPEGYQLVVERYYQGIASARSYGYWVWADLACVVIAAGPAVVAGLRRTAAETFLGRERRWDDPVVLLTAAALVTILAADISGLAKAEVERIWLPFVVWLLPATSLLPARARRWWLAGQAVVALVVNHLLVTFW
jgi:hypothetical protein